MIIGEEPKRYLKRGFTVQSKAFGRKFNARMRKLVYPKKEVKSMGVFDRLGKVLHEKTVKAGEVQAYKLHKEHPNLSYIATGKKLKYDPELEKEVSELKGRQVAKKAKVKRVLGKGVELVKKGIEYDRKHGKEVREHYAQQFKPTKEKRVKFIFEE